MSNNYDNMSQEDFDRLLVEVINEDNNKPSDLLQVPGIAEILMEHYNNAVLEAYDTEHEDDEPSEPEEEDLTTEDHRHFFSVGGPGRMAFELEETDDGTFRVLVDGNRINRRRYATVEAAVKGYMEHVKFFPNCWFISDHGNAHLMKLGDQ